MRKAIHSSSIGNQAKMEAIKRLVKYFYNYKLRIFGLSLFAFTMQKKPKGSL